MARVFVMRLFREAIGRRNPTTEELDHWTAVLVGGGTGASVAHAFFTSNSFLNRGVSDNEYVTILFRALIGRTPNTQEVAHWVNQLRSGVTRHSVFTSFVESDSFARVCREHGIIRGSAPPPVNTRRDNTMEARVWNLIVAQSFRGISDRPEHIAGIIGNLQSEAGPGLCPFQQELGGSRAGLGLMQWSFGRRTALENFMWSNGICHVSFHHEMNKHITGVCSNPRGEHPTALLDRVLEVQISFMFHELQHTSERLYMDYVNFPVNRTGVAGARAYAELFCAISLRPSAGWGDTNNIQDEGVINALRDSPYAGGRGNLNRISYSGLAARRNRAEQVYLQFLGNQG